MNVRLTEHTIRFRLDDHTELQDLADKHVIEISTHIPGEISFHWRLEVIDSVDFASRLTCKNSTVSLQLNQEHLHRLSNDPHRGISITLPSPNQDVLVLVEVDRIKKE